MKKWPFPEKDVDMWGNPIKWQHCIHCGGMVFTILPPEQADCRTCRKPIVELKPSRKGIPQGLRMRVFERDDFTCKKCGSRKDLHADHINPVAKGGETTMQNMQTLCGKCNKSKGAR